MAGGIRHALWAACLLIVGCGGGGGADSTPPPPASPGITSFSSGQPGYFVGGTAQLTAVFQNGNGRLDPGNIAVTSGQPITTPVLSEDVTYRLTVSSGATTVTRDLAIDVSYRERFRTLNMPFSRAEHAAVNLPDGRVLIVGGDEWGNTLPSAVYQFNPASETFTKFGDLSTGRVAMIVVTLANGDVLVGYGGRALTQAPPAEILNGATGASMPTIGVPHHPRHYATATLLADGRVLIAGGSGNGIADPTAELYDSSTGMFTLLQATLSKGRFSHTATRLNNGRVLIYGGHTGDNLPAPPELFDPATLVFTPLPDSRCSAQPVRRRSADGRTDLPLRRREDIHDPVCRVDVGIRHRIAESRRWPVHERAPVPAYRQHASERKGAGRRRTQRRVDAHVDRGDIRVIVEILTVPMRSFALDETHDPFSSIRDELCVSTQGLGVRQRCGVKARDSLYHLDICSPLFSSSFLQDGGGDRLGFRRR